MDNEVYLYLFTSVSFSDSKVTADGVYNRFIVIFISKVIEIEYDSNRGDSIKVDA